MVYNLSMDKILEAIRFATVAHAGQTRKGKPDVPYITHPLAVGLLLAKIGASEDIIIAGILHDTIEDTDATKESIGDIFVKAVAEMVNDVTEQNTSLSWQERKKAALMHIPHMSHGSLMVKTADVIHNMNDLITDYELSGDEMFKHFNAGREEQVKRYEKLTIALNKAWPHNPLLSELKSQLIKLQDLWE
jgi:(p)ppGpp synthase/HD superfamily hydrolase